MYRASWRPPTVSNHFWQSISTPTASGQPRSTASLRFPSLTDAGRIRFVSNSYVMLEIVHNLFWKLSVYENFDSRPPTSARRTTSASPRLSAGNSVLEDKDLNCVELFMKWEDDFSGKAQPGIAQKGVLVFFLERPASLAARCSRRERSDSLSCATSFLTFNQNRASALSTGSSASSDRVGR